MIQFIRRSVFFGGAALIFVSAPAHSQDRYGLLKHSNRIPGKYIVVIKKGVSSGSIEFLMKNVSLRGRISYKFKTVFQGFAVELDEGEAIRLAGNPIVAFVEEDSSVNVEPAKGDSISKSDDIPLSWGLDRIDQSDLPLDQHYGYQQTGKGVSAYIVDTGIRISHQEFEGRASLGFSVDSNRNRNGDCHGHGTHVSGTVGGKHFGVAKDVKLIAVQVLSCAGTGSVAGVVAGLDWVQSHHVKPAVVNMSLAGGQSQAMDQAIRSVVSSGLTVVVAAGNRAANACSYSPSGVLEAITVGSTSSQDFQSSFSNSGKCVDVLAPGESIISASIESDSSSELMSGTSMASPHVAGVAALFLELKPMASPAEVWEVVKKSAAKDRLQGIAADTSNLLLQSSFLMPF